jgi:hypothetical protein
MSHSASFFGALKANNAFHLTAGLAFARPPAGECER